MKKTITINLSGIIFNIDEDAHEKLSQYLTKIKSYFSNSEGKEEIMADIEARIAEMFQEIIGKTKEVINIDDVSRVISIMGKPEDYIDSESDEKESKTHENYNTAYSERRRRVFRDPDNKVLGGVCSGISAYFNFDPIWVRLAFVFSFFFLFGSSFLIYILLWIIIPEAKNTAEKLEMRGENVNISSIEKSIKEEMENLKKKFDRLKDEAQNINTKPYTERAKNIFEKIIGFIVSVVTFAFKAVLKLIGVIFVAVGLMVLLVLLASVLGGSDAIYSFTPTGINSFPFNDLLSIFFVSEKQVTMVSIALLLIIGLPLIAIIYHGIKLLLGIKKKVRGFGFITFALWLSGIMLGVYTGIQVAGEFRREGKITRVIPLNQPVNKNFYLSVSKEDPLDIDADGKVMINDWFVIKNDNGEIINFGNVRLNIVRSKTDSFQIVVVSSSRGQNRKDAIQRAGNINYNLAQSDTVMAFNGYYSIPDNERWRNQRVRVLVKVPEGGSVYLDESMEGIIYDIDNANGTNDMDMLGKKWTMLEKGLTCLDCDESEL